MLKVLKTLSVLNALLAVVQGCITVSLNMTAKYFVRGKQKFSVPSPK